MPSASEPALMGTCTIDFDGGQLALRGPVTVSPSCSQLSVLNFRYPCYRQPVLRTMHMKIDDDEHRFGKRLS